MIESTLAQQREPLRPDPDSQPDARRRRAARGRDARLVLHLNQWRQMAGLRAELEELAPACARATELRLKLAAAEAKLQQLNALEKQLPQAELAANPQPHQPKHAGRRLARPAHVSTTASPRRSAVLATPTAACTTLSVI